MDVRYPKQHERLRPLNATNQFRAIVSRLPSSHPELQFKAKYLAFKLKETNSYKRNKNLVTIFKVF